MTHSFVACKACGNTFKGNYCNKCGQKLMGRFSFSYLWQWLREEIFEIDRGLLLTFYELWVRPGKMVLDYIGGNTKKYYGPLKYLIFWTAIFLFTASFMPQGPGGALKIPIAQLIFNDHQVLSESGIDDFSKLVVQLMVGNVNIYVLVIIPFVADIAYLFYRKKFNFTEHVILFTYFFGQYNFFLGLIFLLGSLFGASPFGSTALDPLSALLIQNLVMLPISVNFFMMLKQFFQQKWLTTIFKGIAVFYASFFSYLLFLFGVFATLKFIF